MKSSHVINYKEFSAKNIILEEPKYNAISDCYIGKLNYKNRTKFLLQTCNLILEEDIKSDDNNYFLYLKIAKTNHVFYNCLYELDKAIIKQVASNAEWFDSETMHESYVEDIYKSIMFLPKSLDDGPLIKLRIPIVNNSISCQIFDKVGTKVTLKELEKNKEIVLLLDMSTILFYKHKFLIDFNICQIKLCHYQLNTNNYLFCDDSDEENDQANERLTEYIDSDCKV